MSNNNNSSPKYNLRKRKKISEPISDDDSSSDYNPNDEDKDEKYLEICNYISKVFPNKYGNTKTQKNKIKKNKKNKINKKYIKGKKYKNKNEKIKQHENIKNNKNNISNFSSKYGKSYNLLLTFDDDYNKNDDNIIIDSVNKKNDYNMILNNGVYYYYPNYNQEEEDEDEDEEYMSESSDNEEKEKKSLSLNEKIKVKLKDWDDYYNGTIKKVRKNGHYDIKLDDEKDEYGYAVENYEMIKDVPIKYIKSIEKEEKYKKLINELEDLSKSSKDDNLMEKFRELSNAYKIKKDKEEKEKENEEMKKNCKKFITLIKNKSKFNDIKYFKSLSIEKQNIIIDNLKEINKYNKIDKPYRISLIEKNMPNHFKSIALKKINSFNNMDPCNGEYYKIKNWIDGFMQIPFGNYSKLPLQMSDGLDKCSEFLDNSKKILDECVFGLENAKMQILQYIGQWLVNPNTIGTAIAIKGPPGTGKTTLIKEGISKILNRPFGFIALGGATDSSFLEGHSYTYEGSVWGKVVDLLIQSKCMNPIIYMDELDKISNSPKGDEITGILTHLTDTTQNDKFHDKYFSSIDFNLSKSLFIFSYNDESKINPILKDRMYRIKTEGFKPKDKLTIAKKYIIPKIEKNLQFKPNDIIFDDICLKYIIEKYTEDEKGVRNLKRCIEIIFTKINLFRLSKKNNYLFKDKHFYEIKFPFKLTTEIINKIIEKNKDDRTFLNIYT